MSHVTNRLDTLTNTGFPQGKNLDSALSHTEGAYRGERVIQLNSGESLINSQEELTATMSEHREKELARRDMTEGKETDLIKRLMELSEIKEMLNTLGDMGERDLERALKQLLRQRDASPQQLREQVREQFKEPAHQFAALSALVAALKEQGASSSRIEAAQAALNQLLKEQGPAVRAGVNISEVAKQIAGGEHIQSLRDAYRDAVLDYPGILEMCNALMEKHKKDGSPALLKEITFLLNALGADLAAHGSSIDKNKLTAIRNDMHRLQTLMGLLEKCDTVIDTFERQGAFSQHSSSPIMAK